MKEVFCEREGSYERASRLFFFKVYCFFKLRLRRSGYGVKEAEEWCESFWSFSVFWRERFWLFGEGLLLGAFFFLTWCGLIGWRKTLVLRQLQT